MRVFEQRQDWLLAQHYGIFDSNSEDGRAALLAFEADRRANSEHYQSHVAFKLLPESVQGPWPFVLLRPELGADQLGLFASRAYRKGETILEYMGERKYVNSIEETQGVFVFTVQEKNGRCCVIDPSDQGGLARYANQTVSPNMRYELQDGRLWLIANKDISVGEEISGQYGDNKAALVPLKPSSVWIYFLRHLLLNNEQDRARVVEKLTLLNTEFAHVVMNSIFDLKDSEKLPVLPRKFAFGLTELKGLLELPAPEQGSAMEVEELSLEQFLASGGEVELSCLTPRVKTEEDIYQHPDGASAMPNFFSPVRSGKKGVDPVPLFSFDF